MNVLIRYSLGLGRAAVLISAVIVAMIGLGQDTGPVKGAPTAEIIMSYSNVIPIRASTIILNPAGNSRDIYIWAKGVEDPSGVAAYNLELYFDDTRFTMTSFRGNPTWLSSSGRSGACAPPGIIEPSHAYLACVTIGAAPPFGATGDGLLAKLVISPLDELAGASVLDLSASENGGTYLLNTPANPNDCFPIQPSCYVPVTLLNSVVIFIRCADNSPPGGDGIIDLPNDILGVIQHYQVRESDPEWDQAFDLDYNGTIDLANDILGTILQYQNRCWQTV